MQQLEQGRFCRRVGVGVGAGFMQGAPRALVALLVASMASPALVGCNASRSAPASSEPLPVDGAKPQTAEPADKGAQGATAPRATVATEADGLGGAHEAKRASGGPVGGAAPPKPLPPARYLGASEAPTEAAAAPSTAPPVVATATATTGGAGPSVGNKGDLAGSFATQPAKGAPAAPVERRDQVIDPNGRFATTYRPGGGHLSAFESAVARGIVPQEDREIVSDVGARYGAPAAVPPAKSLGLRVDLERGKAPPSGGPTHLRLALRSTDKAPAERPHLSVHLVLDVSGSMAGQAIENARKAAQALVDKLAPGDDFSLVTFSSEAEVKVPDGPVGSRREQIKQTIEKIREGGGTNIGAGLALGYAEAAKPSVPRDAVRVVLLLSDGHVNAGILDKNRLSKLALDAFQGGVQTSTFGLGADYDGPLMSAIAADGAGGYYYLRDSEQIAPALTTELDKRLDPVATAVEVRVRLKKGVELLQVYGSRRLSDAEAARVRAQEVAADAQAAKRDGIARDRDDDQQGGMRFFMPAFARGDGHAMLFKLRVPEGVGSKPIALVELKYKDRVARKNVAEELPVSIVYASSDAESGASVDPQVARSVQGFAAGEALAEAAARVDRGDRAGAAALLAEREQILRTAAEQLGEPLFLRDADRLARLRAHTGQTTGVGDPLVLAMLLETAGRVHLR